MNRSLFRLLTIDRISKVNNNAGLSDEAQALGTIIQHEATNDGFIKVTQERRNSQEDSTSELKTKKQKEN